MTKKKAIILIKARTISHNAEEIAWEIAHRFKSIQESVRPYYLSVELTDINKASQSIKLMNLLKEKKISKEEFVKYSLEINDIINENSNDRPSGSPEN